MSITKIKACARSFKRENAPRRSAGQPIMKDTENVRVKAEDGIVGTGEAHYALVPTRVANGTIEPSAAPRLGFEVEESLFAKWPRIAGALLRMNNLCQSPGLVRSTTVILAKAGIHNTCATRTHVWISAFAGMTVLWMVASCFLPGYLHAADWKPEKTVEIVVNTVAGNGPDRTARVIQGIVQDKKQVDVPVVIGNKVGGGGVVAYSYVNSRPADGHTLIISSKALLSNHIAGRGPSYTEFTPVALLYTEYMLITVKPDSPILNGKDLVERVKKNPASVSFGIATSLGNPIHQSVAAPLRAEGIDIKLLRNVVFNAGSASLAAMMGGHVDVVPVTGALASQLSASKQVRLLAASSPRRLTGALADVPTWRELGYDVVVAQWRGVMGPKGMPDAQVAYWERTLKRMTEADEWKRDLEKNFWVADFMGARELRQFMENDNATLKRFLGELGLTDKK